MKIINPATEEVILEIEADSLESVQTKIKKLRQGQKQWRSVGVKERLAAIVRFGQLVEDNLEELAAILTAETGKPIQQSRNEIKGAHGRIHHLQNNAQKWLAPEVIVAEGATREEINYEPLGVIANISAWNFPYNVGYNVFLYALVAGNAVCYKPSEFASLTGLKFKELLWKAGIPEDVFECFIGSGEIGEALTEAGLDGYFFTGSYATGKYIARKVAPQLVPLQLELGGKDPLYIAEDVENIKQAAINAAEGAFYNNGQSCCSVERIYVHDKIYPEFVRYFVAEVETYKMGDPTHDDTFIGPLTRKPQLKILKKQIEDALQKGARLETGGNMVPSKGYYMPPAVLTQVNHDMLLMKEESFGPLIGIQQVSGDEEAVQLMQDTEYGLTAAVFCREESRARRLLEKMDTGTVYWNCCDRVSPHVPWSGRKNSGLGSTLSYIGIRAFVQPKAYHLRG
jgi:acyl-CoA reductase-like NAD-dependent aldehyde dehydrogenase